MKSFWEDPESISVNIKISGTIELNRSSRVSLPNLQFTTSLQIYNEPASLSEPLAENLAISIQLELAKLCYQLLSSGTSESLKPSSPPSSSFRTGLTSTSLLRSLQNIARRRLSSSSMDQPPTSGDPWTETDLYLLSKPTRASPGLFAPSETSSKKEEEPETKNLRPTPALSKNYVKDLVDWFATKANMSGRTPSSPSGSADKSQRKPK